MKPSRLFALLCAFALSLNLLGCGHAPVERKPVLMIQPLLDKIVPADFQGDGEFGTRGHYVTIEVKAGGLRRLRDGRWSWRWLTYRQTINVPLLLGVPYKNEGWVTLGSPDEKKDDAK